jgi:hypothetical protein
MKSPENQPPGEPIEKGVKRVMEQYPEIFTPADVRAWVLILRNLAGEPACSPEISGETSTLGGMDQEEDAPEWMADQIKRHQKP